MTFSAKWPSVQNDYFDRTTFPAWWPVQPIEILNRMLISVKLHFRPDGFRPNDIFQKTTSDLVALDQMVFGWMTFGQTKNWWPKIPTLDHFLLLKWLYIPTLTRPAFYFTMKLEFSNLLIESISWPAHEYVSYTASTKETLCPESQYFLLNILIRSME